MSILVLTLPRRYALIPVLMVVCYLTRAAKIEIFVDFTMWKIILLVGWIRIICRRELSSIEMNTVDKLFILWVISGTVINTILWQTTEAMTYRLGLTYHALGMYFYSRAVLKEFDDIIFNVKACAIIIIPLALCMIFEKVNGRNVFAPFGGVPEIPEFRDGSFRCQGPFAHPVLAGTVGAGLIPLFVGLYLVRSRGKWVFILGLLAAVTIMITSHSSGPILATGAGILGLCFWPFRRSMRLIRWGILLGLIGLHLVMKSPVWSLIGRLSFITGGTGYHRSMLIDAAVKYFGDWWLIGTTYTAHWIPYALHAGSDSTDLTNQYIYEAVNGGLLTMILFLLLIASAFREVGRALRVMEEEIIPDRIFIWSMGAALFLHVMSFISVSYFDTTIAFWFLLVAMIAPIGRLPISKGREVSEGLNS